VDPGGRVRRRGAAGRSKDQTTPSSEAAVFDAATGRKITALPPLPNEGLWLTVAAAGDNWTFLVSGWTASAANQYRALGIKLDEQERPGIPVPVPGSIGIDTSFAVSSW
jgi:hypothetical protein